MPLYHLTEGRHGRFLTYANDLIIGRCMQLYGEWSEHEIWLYRQIVRPGDVIVEPGANIGTHSVYL
ncbi:MAG: FkbM family methyltransferase, partial [Proteobacteria bacterium]|nr:FkbM family methyltransferase [Pseudomonadota bacterium]